MRGLVCALSWCVRVRLCVCVCAGACVVSLLSVPTYEREGMEGGEGREGKREMIRLEEQAGLNTRLMSTTKDPSLAPGRDEHGVTDETCAAAVD